MQADIGFFEILQAFDRNLVLGEFGLGSDWLVEIGSLLLMCWLCGKLPCPRFSFLSPYREFNLYTSVHHLVSCIKP